MTLPAVLALTIAVLVLSGCSKSDGDDSIATTTLPGQTTTTVTIPPVSAAKAALQFAPVLNHGACPTAGAPVTVPGLARIIKDTDGKACWSLGPVAGDGNDIESAKVEADPSASADAAVVVLSPRLRSRPKLNILFNACFEKKATCPAQAGGTGAVAFVYNGKVRAAPAINAKNLASVPFQFTGLSLEEAARLTATLNGT